MLWETFLPQPEAERVHQKNGHASATPVTDGQLVYASFGRNGLAAFDLGGKLAWHTSISAVDNYHGPAGSPVLYKDRLFLYQDHGRQGSFVAAFEAKTGKKVWETPRNAKPSGGARRS